MTALIVSNPGVMSVGIARRIEAHRLPASLARNLPPAVAAALSFGTMAAEDAAGGDLVTIAIGGAVSRADLATALDLAEQSLKPSGPADCLLATARLRAVARHRPTITADEKLALVVYAEKLGRYPADAVAMACERWFETSPFWPAVSELLRMVEWALQPRRELALALTRKMQEAAE
jgi:hypothetical protein